MPRLVVKGKDPLLESAGYNFRFKVVKFSQRDEALLKSAIELLDKAAKLWAKVSNDGGDNPYRQAALEVREALDF